MGWFDRSTAPARRTSTPFRVVLAASLTGNRTATRLSQVIGRTGVDRHAVSSRTVMSGH